MKSIKIQLFTLFSISSALVFGQRGASFASANYSNTGFTSAIVAESSPKVSLSAKEVVDLEIEKMLEDPVLKTAKWGFTVYDPKTKEVIAAHNQDMPLIPASTTKLLTTESALSKLGTNFKWTTQLEYSGEINEEGVLDGNLYIVGSGDPSLGVNRGGSSSYSVIVADFASAVQKAGIKEVKGNIFIQSAFFKSNRMPILPQNIVWLEHNNYYLPIGMSSEIGTHKEQKTQENTPFSKSRKYYYQDSKIGKMVYTNDFVGEAITSKLPDAPAYLANTLLTSLVKRGTKVSGKVINKNFDANPEERRILEVYQSPTLGAIVHHINQTSYNPYADNLLKYLGFYEMGDMTLKSGSQSVKENFDKRNFDFEGLNYADGSGLSRANVVTPISQVKFLSSLMKEKYFDQFFKSLPVGGESGTLRGSFKGEAYCGGKVFAKTGTLNGVKTLAGFVKTHSGKILVFSLLINGYKGSVAQVKSRMEKILEPVLDL